MHVEIGDGNENDSNNDDIMLDYVQTKSSNETNLNLVKTKQKYFSRSDRAFLWFRFSL